MMPAMEESVQAALRELEKHARHLYGDRMSGLVLFGSHARGEAGPDSDLDVAIVLRGTWRRLEEMERCAPLRRAVEASTGLRVDLTFLSPAEWAGNPAGETQEPEIYATIREEGRFFESL